MTWCQLSRRTRHVWQLSADTRADTEKPGKARKAQRKEDGGEKPEMLQEVGGNEGAMRDLGR